MFGNAQRQPRKVAKKCGLISCRNVSGLYASNPYIYSTTHQIPPTERPLIIHNCKFDIRQWFLVTSVTPLIIWMYRECYLRFSTQQFSLRNFHESVHLTNHAVQKRYKNNDQRDARLPADNMWDTATFCEWLEQRGATDAWKQRIYPGMQRALIGAMLASQDLMDRRSNTFELFGADFMLTEDYQPWLLEINASPDLAASTGVTSRMCPQCLDDLVKGGLDRKSLKDFFYKSYHFPVVIDHRANPKASTGQFELIYKQTMPLTPSYLGIDLALSGTRIIPKSANRSAEEPPISSYYFVPTLKLPEQTTLPPFLDAVDHVDRKPMRRSSTSTPRRPPTSRVIAASVAKTKTPTKNGHVSRFRSSVSFAGMKSARDRSRQNPCTQKQDTPTADADDQSAANVKPTVTLDRPTFSSSMPLLPLDDGGQRRIHNQHESHPAVAMGMNCVGKSCRKTLPTIGSLLRLASMSSTDISALRNNAAHQLLYRADRRADAAAKNPPMEVDVSMSIAPFCEAVLDYKSSNMSARSLRRRQIN